MSTLVHPWRKKPWPEGSIWVGKARDGSTGYYANPHSAGLDKCPECWRRFRVKTFHTPPAATEIFRQEFLEKVINDEAFRGALMHLVGKPLVCGCPQKKECSEGFCNGKVIGAFLDGLPERPQTSDFVQHARNDLARLASEAVEEAEGPNDLAEEMRRTGEAPGIRGGT